MQISELRMRNRFSGDYLTALADRYFVVSRQWVPMKMWNESWKGERIPQRGENRQCYSAVLIKVIDIG